MKIKLAIFIVFMSLIPNWNFAQSIDVLTEHVLCDSDGGQNQNGKVLITLGSGGQPYKVSVSTPCKEENDVLLSGVEYQIDAIDPNEFEFPVCPGEYCFDFVARAGTEYECCKRYCTVVKVCIAREEGVLGTPIYDCFNPNLSQEYKAVEFGRKSKINNTEVYPNPFLSEISLSFQAIFIGEIEFLIRNVSGEAVHSEKVNVTYGQNNFHITNLDYLPPSVYFLHILDSESNQILTVQKVVKS